MRDIHAISVTSEAALALLSDAFRLVDHGFAFHEHLAVLARPLPFCAVLDRLDALGLEVAGVGTLIGEAGEPRGPFRTVYAQRDTGRAALRDAA